MSLEIIGLRECRPPTSRSESDLNTEFGPTRLGSVQRGSSGGAVPSPAVSQYSDELRRPAWRLQGSHSAKNPAPQNLGQAHVCARDLLEMIDGAASRVQRDQRAGQSWRDDHRAAAGEHGKRAWRRAGRRRLRWRCRWRWRWRWRRACPGRLWLRRRMRIIPRILVSLVLLIPFFGLMIYFFIGSDLDKNPDRMDTQSDSDAFYGGGGGL